MQTPLDEREPQLYVAGRREEEELTTHRARA